MNLQAQKIIDRIYRQVLTNTWGDADGSPIRLSLAYGDDQRGGLQAHMREVCYLVLGLGLKPQSRGKLSTAFRKVPVSRLHTRFGTRQESVTYWFQFGNETMKPNGCWENRLVESRFTMTGQVPLGRLFRVSSIDPETDCAFAMRDRFIRDMLGAVSAADRLRLDGFVS